MVSKSDVLRAMRIYDQQYPTNDYPRTRPGQKSWLERDRYSQALQHSERLYPPKKIWSLITGADIRDFNTQSATRILEGLGSTISEKPGSVRSREVGGRG